MTKNESPDAIQGEGDYVSGRKFQDLERAFVEKGGVDRAARAAADALEGPEGAALEEARRSSAMGEIPGKPKGNTSPNGSGRR